MIKELLVRLFLKYGKDRGVWVAASTFISHLLSKKLGLDLDATLITDLLVGLVTWAATHWLHVKMVENKLVKEIEVPEIGKKENKE